MDQQCLTAQWSWRVSPEGRVHVVVIGCWCPVGPVLASLRSLCVCPTTGGGSCEQRRAKPLQLVFMWCSTPQPRATLFGKCSLLRCVCMSKGNPAVTALQGQFGCRQSLVAPLARRVSVGPCACPPMRSLRPQLECPVFTHVQWHGCMLKECDVAVHGRGWGG